MEMFAEGTTWARDESFFIQWPYIFSLSLLFVDAREFNTILTLPVETIAPGPNIEHGSDKVNLVLSFV